MFTLCPHCQFLVALDPATGRAPADCPRCGKPLATPATDDRGADETATQAIPAQEGQALPAVDTDAAPPASSDDAMTPPAASASVGAEARPKRVRAAKSRTATVVPPPATEASGEAPITAPAGMATADTGATANPAIAEAASREEAPTEAGGSGDDAQAPEPATAGEAAPAVDVPELPPAATEDIAEAASAQESAGPDAPPVARRRHLPSFAHPLRAPVARPGVRTITAIAVLALLLVLQLLLADRARLAADARWRPLLSALCGVLQCELPAWREPAAFTLLARDVRPARRGVLHVSATFRNDARWPQPWPALRLALQDVDGRTIGARTLRPDEYHPRIGADARITQSRLAPGQSARIAFDIVEPAGTAVAFTFDFR